MSTDCRKHQHNSRCLLLPEHAMNHQQFEHWKSQLSQLSPQQLLALQGEIARSLHQGSTSLLTDEELDTITHLFS